ncbi:MAG TPA: FAD-dependent oxidoreductase, partial [Blastocatellia bacterium]|nr:FAD-dependent oxidoreductase [Blastocatellia bacterium]
MQTYMRRTFTGILAGLLGSIVLALTMRNTPLAVLLGVLVGIGYSTAFRPVLHAYMDSMMNAASMAVPLWALLNVVLLPIMAGLAPRWTADGMRTLVPSLVGWVVYGACLGLLNQGLSDLAFQWFGPEPAPPPPPEAKRNRILILGGGFGGMTTAENLERLFAFERGIEVTLVSDSNALLFTPMLAEVAGSSLEPTHISSPLRTSLRRTQVVRARVDGINLEGRTVTVDLNGFREHGDPGDSGDHGDPASGRLKEIGFDHLVLALGSVSNYLGMHNLETNSFQFKTLLDAIRIRNHVIDMFEYADREADSVRRRQLLTFVVAGGGFAGAEVAGAVNDFARGILPDYPGLSADEIRILLVHSRDRILPELSPSLAAYALDRMSTRGVEFMLGRRLTDARPGEIVLDSGDAIAAQTLIWTAGTAPNPLLRTLPVGLDKRGAVVVDRNLAVPEQNGLWALGDCAAVTDAKTGKACPPTAQFALREGRTVARNIRATLKGQPLTSFHFDSLGALCVVGHHTACAEL